MKDAEVARFRPFPSHQSATIQHEVPYSGWRLGSFWLYYAKPK